MLAVVLDKGLLGLPLWITASLVWLVFVTTLASGINYVWVWSRRAASQGDNQQS